MTTTLLALTFAPNLERLLRDIQDILFRWEAIVSSRALPPIVPILRLSSTPVDSTLDRIRKRCPITLAPPPHEICTRNGIVLLPTRFHGFETLVAACRSCAGETVSDGVPPIIEAPVSIHLAWDAPHRFQPQTNTRATQIASRLPSTSAFWLSVFEIESGPDRWWDGCTYRVPYRRRLTVRRR